MRVIKNILITILLAVVTVCAFGGGCIIWTILAIFIQPSPEVTEIMFYITCFVPAPFCWYIAPKIAKKYLP